MQFFEKTNINFIGLRKFFFFFAITFIVVGIGLVSIFGIDFGIDFTGGSEIAVKFENIIQTDDFRSAILKGGVKADEIKSYGADNQFLIRTKETGKIADKIKEIIQTNIPNNNFEILKTDSIGPKVGEELAFQAAIAVVLAFVGMLIYIAFRFKFEYGLGAVVALIHDVIVSFIIIVLVQKTGIFALEINQGIVAAMLTVVGYSVNDKVVIFDRIRENTERSKGIDFHKIVNVSINETLSRTIITGISVMGVLFLMLFTAGQVLQGFVFTMLIGSIIGTYSSIYIASSFVIWFLEKRHKISKDIIKYDNKKAVVTV